MRRPQNLADAGTAPSIVMLQRCVERAERAGDHHVLTLLMARLDMQNYKIIGAAAKVAASPPNDTLAGPLHILSHCFLILTPSEGLG